MGPLNIGSMGGLPISGARVEVAHMHFFRYDDDARVADLRHVWNTLALARQIGPPAPA
jgi:predicted ester cyclase